MHSTYNFELLYGSYGDSPLSCIAASVVYLAAASLHLPRCPWPHVLPERRLSCGLIKARARRTTRMHNDYIEYGE